jgi:hypothetical protein
MINEHYMQYFWLGLFKFVDLSDSLALGLFQLGYVSSGATLRLGSEAVRKFDRKL